MKISARNLFRGRVTCLIRGAVNSEVTLDVAGTALVAVVTNEAVEALGLAEGGETLALIKASSVLVGVGEGTRLSARNQLVGTVSRVVEGAVNGEVVIDLDQGSEVVAVLTNASIRRLGLVVGTRASAIIKASSVLLAVE